MQLFPNSPCINAGDPSIQDSDGSTSDMGAYPYLLDHDGSAGWYVSTIGSDTTGTGAESNPFGSIQMA